MPKYHVIGLFTASKSLGVFEAATEDEAIEMALESIENYVSICHQCSREFNLDEHCAHEAVAELHDDE